MTALRKLVLGETWALPIGVALVVVAGLALDAAFGSEEWWRRGGGFLLLAGAVGALTAALRRARPRRR